MKLVCAQNDLSNQLSLVSRAVPSRPNHPVLANVLFQADTETQQVSLTAFDLSLGIYTTMPARVEEAGALALPAKLLNEIVSRLPAGELTVAMEESDTAATLTSASGQYTVRGMDPEEFPELPVVPEGEVVRLSSAAVLEGLRGSLFAASEDETKQVLSGIHLAIKPDGLEFAATDGHRLAVVETENELAGGESGAVAELEVTVPVKALRELERFLSPEGETSSLVMRCDPGQVVFELGDRRLTSRTLDGQYPPYRQLIPRQFARQLTTDRRQLLRALESISVLADQRNNVVKLSIDGDRGQIFISADAQDIGSGKENLAADITGESIDIAFNVRYVMESLKNLPSSEIQLQLNTATSPVVFSPLGGAKMTHLIMPVQIRGN